LREVTFRYQSGEANRREHEEFKEEKDVVQFLDSKLFAFLADLAVYLHFPRKLEFHGSFGIFSNI